MDRRAVLKIAGLALAGIALMPLDALSGGKKSEICDTITIHNAAAPGRRKLGSLEVLSIGLWVQNMSRTYHTTIPSRPEIQNIIHKAYR